MLVSGQRHAPAALCPGERTHGTHFTGGWVGLRAMMMEVARTPETSVDIDLSTRQYIPGDSELK
jgi:hypothetical protein